MNKTNKTGIIFFLEGDTEKIFYKKAIKYIYDKYNINKIEIKYKVIGTIFKFDRKLIGIYSENYKDKYEETIVCLCYDTDVFEFSAKPNINWNKIDKELKELGANKIIHVKADKCIEDLFLIDIDGILKHLKVKGKIKIEGKNGVEKLKKIYAKANKTYLKGTKSEDLVNKLNIELICKEKLEINKELIKVIKNDNI